MLYTCMLCYRRRRDFPDKQLWNRLIYSDKYLHVNDTYIDF